MFSVTASFDQQTFHCSAIESDDGDYDSVTICLLKYLLEEGDVHDSLFLIKDDQLRQFFRQHVDEDITTAIPEFSDDVKRGSLDLLNVLNHAKLVLL